MKGHWNMAWWPTTRIDRRASSGAALLPECRIRGSTKKIACMGVRLGCY